ncbi:MAG TPA: hypothetical protein VGC19_00865 [Rhodanobacter sp.]
MSWQDDSHPSRTTRSPSADAHELALMAFEQPSPVDLAEAVILMRRWTRLPHNRKPEVDFVYKGIRSRSMMGFLAWLVDMRGSRIYATFRILYPFEAEAFRRQLLILCKSRAKQLSTMNGSGLAYVFSRALARHAKEFPNIVLGEIQDCKAHLPDADNSFSTHGELPK